ncbi:shikimate kinase [Desulfatitalea alkaliphila]|uniref:Shikimate kinase n=1 Tax=Desulfatitalea alkaliphila TaxID=2929485 RepID=A0AA41UJF8_9BACT|nr:shikimate kinase [Desulfatitalea alkaliphila]
MNNIFLIGYRCTGKTTLGRALARRLDRPFVDTDDAITAATGQDIRTLVNRCGWDHFRDLERRQIAASARLTHHVVATGGGAVLAAENVAAMRAGGTVVWLRCRPDTIERLMRADVRSDAMRPRLTGDGLRREIETTLAAREPLYRRAMHFALDTDDFDIDRLCDTIIAAVQASGPTPPDYTTNQ